MLTGVSLIVYGVVTTVERRVFIADATDVGGQGRHRAPYRPSASAVSSALVLAPTLRSRFDTWNLTVLALIPS